jgi:hypothetical protein
MKVNKRKITFLLLSTAIAVLFFCWVIKPPSYFNFIPYQIHETFMQGDKHESEFIIAFDAACSLLLMLTINKLLSRFY